MVVRFCQLCDKEFKTYQSEIRKGGGKFCSHSCSSTVSSTRHGDSESRLYAIWCGIKTRCIGSGSALAKRYYHGRNISVCQEWRDGYESFRDWAMPNGYEDHLEIDRIDPTGNYEPSNCRWVTRFEQMRNIGKKQSPRFKSRFKGVGQTTRPANKWIARIRANQKEVYLGVFDSEIEAAKAYDRAALEHFGEYANINFPQAGAKAYNPHQDLL